MPNIQILSPHVADLIAAGEVVERPASVVKELLENAIDAGARSVTVQIRSGGMESIRVIDDGCGMSPEDAGVAFLRHATSKLRDEAGLERIGTLGFRGEALAAISSVSHIELRTRERGTEAGTYVALTAGDIQEMGPTGCPEGTDMLVRDLFYNTPARLKFMKSDRAESSACVAAALRVALGRPEISVRMQRDGEEVFFSPGDGQMRSAVYTLLGRDNAANLLECAGESEGVQVRGYVTAPHAGRGNRSMQFFFVNGRVFRSATVQAALEQAYRNTLLTGRFPGCVLYLTLPAGKVDVNVHPTKSEVRFTDEKRVFDAVYGAVKSALEERGTRATAEIRLSPSTERAAAQPRADFYKSMTAEEFRSSGLAASAGRGQASGSVPAAPAGRGQASGVPVQTRLDLPRGSMANLPLRDAGETYGTSERVPAPDLPWKKAPEPAPAEKPGAAPGKTEEPSQPTPSTPKCAVPDDTPDFRVIGEALDTYILVESGEALWLIDKHACHERILFDRLLAGLGAAMSQTLLHPITYAPGAEGAELLEQNRETLETLGFELDRFGEDAVILRAVPADCDGDETALLEALLEDLRAGKAEDPRETLCHTIACKAAIKAARRSQLPELEALAARVLSGEIRYCPHGRPVCVKLTKTELDRQFKRIV